MRRSIVSALFLLAAAVGARGQAVTLRLLPASPADRNYRVGAMAGFSVAYVPDQYRVYATTSLPRGRWLDDLNLRDYFSESLTGAVKDPDRCWVSSTQNYD